MITHITIGSEKSWTATILHFSNGFVGSNELWTNFNSVYQSVNKLINWFQMCN